MENITFLSFVTVASSSSLPFWKVDVVDRCRLKFYFIQRQHYKSRIFESMVSPLQPVFKIFMIFSWKTLNRAMNLTWHICILKRILLMKHQIVGKYQNEMPNVARKAFTLGEIWNPLCCHGNNTFKRKELFKKSKQHFFFRTFYLSMLKNGLDRTRCKVF